MMDPTAEGQVSLRQAGGGHSTKQQGQVGKGCCLLAPTFSLAAAHLIHLRECKEGERLFPGYTHSSGCSWRCPERSSKNANASTYPIIAHSPIKFVTIL